MSRFRSPELKRRDYSSHRPEELVVAGLLSNGNHSTHHQWEGMIPKSDSMWLKLREGDFKKQEN